MYKVRTNRKDRLESYLKITNIEDQINYLKDSGNINFMTSEQILEKLLRRIGMDKLLEIIGIDKINKHLRCLKLKKINHE